MKLTGLKIGEHFDANNYSEIIACRERAYVIGKTRALAIVLARDYSLLGSFYINQNIKQEGFRYYTKAIDKYYDVIKLTKKNGTYKNDLNDIYYDIGQVFHSIGDIKYIDKQWREESYLMSSAFLEIASDDGELFTQYFCGMVNHKLSIISNSDCRSTYLLDSEKYYTRSLEQNIRKRTKINLYKFIADVYNELGYYVKNHVQTSNLCTWKEYWQKRDSLLVDARKMELKTDL